MRVRSLVSGLLLLGLVSCGGESSSEGAEACLATVAPAPDGDWVRAVHRDPETDEIRLTVAGKKTVVLPGNPQRIVSTLPGITETVIWLGAQDRLAAVTEHCELPTAIEDLPRIAVMPLAHEVLAALQPDLVLVDSVLLPQATADLERLGLAVLPLKSRSLEHLRTSVDVLAALFDTPEAAERATRFRRELNEAAARATPPPDGPPQRVLLLAQTDPLFVLGPGSLLDDMVRACGAVNVACDLGRASGPFSEEFVLARKPDIILVLDGALSPTLRGRWASFPALREDRVATWDEDHILQAGPRTPEVLAALSELVLDAEYADADENEDETEDEGVR